MIILNQENIPRSGPCLVTINHYARLGFYAWWLALSVSAAIPAPVHWVITSAWTYPNWMRSHTLTPASRWLFKRVARVYGFTSMPPMPPDPTEIQDRAAAVREVLDHARKNPDAVIGFAPEGGDFAAPGCLASPPPGVGRFVLLLCDQGFPIIPVAIMEKKDQLCLNFGLPYRLDVPPGLSPDDRDAWARSAIMSRIAALLVTDVP
jgi:1-acyl-sn-glycerol-3-phosphate acyltransferase